MRRPPQMKIAQTPYFAIYDNPCAVCTIIHARTILGKLSYTKYDHRTILQGLTDGQMMFALAGEMFSRCNETAPTLVASQCYSVINVQ